MSQSLIAFILPWVILSLIVFIFKGSQISWLDMAAAGLFYLIFNL